MVCLKGQVFNTDQTRGHNFATHTTMVVHVWTLQQEENTFINFVTSLLPRLWLRILNKPNN